MKMVNIKSMQGVMVRSAPELGAADTTKMSGTCCGDKFRAQAEFDRLDRDKKGYLTSTDWWNMLARGGNTQSAVAEMHRLTFESLVEPGDPVRRHLNTLCLGPDPLLLLRHL